MSTICPSHDHRDGRDDNELNYWADRFRIVRYGYDPTMTFQAFMAYDLVQRKALVQSALLMLNEWRDNPRIWDANTPPIVTDWRAHDPTDCLDPESVTITLFHRHHCN